MNAFEDLEPRATRVRFGVMAGLTVAATLCYLIRGAVSVSESTIRQELGLTLAESGRFMSAFFLSYALFQVPTGWWSQRSGTRLSMVCFIVACSVATVAMSWSSMLWSLIAAQLVLGIAQAGVFPAACNSVAKWMPMSQRSFACAVLAVGMQVGAIVASLMSGPLLKIIGWRWLFLIYGLPGFLWAMAFWLRFRDEPSQDRRVNELELAIIQSGQEVSGQEVGGQPDGQPPSANHSPTPWLALVASPSLWFLCMQQACRAAGYMFFASWFPTFLQETRGVSISGSGLLQALVFCGTLVGSLCGGMLTDWIWRRSGSLRWSRSGVGAGALAGCGALIFCAWFVQDVTLAILLLTAGSVCAALAGPCGYAATIDIGGRHVPQVFGLMNMSGNLAAAATPVLVAELFNWTANWNLVLLVFAGVYLCGAMSWILVNPASRPSPSQA